jgi:hypothetical protein
MAMWPEVLQTALHGHSSLAAIRALFEDDVARPEARDEAGWTPLMVGGTVVEGST